MNYFVSRHPGAITWAKTHLTIDRFITHLNPEDLTKGDCIYGTLPVNLAAQCCRQGARYIHLSLSLPEHLRGQELSAQQMQQLNAELQEFIIKEVNNEK